jgi:hypothetical protein
MATVANLGLQPLPWCGSLGGEAELPDAAVAVAPLAPWPHRLLLEHLRYQGAEVADQVLERVTDAVPATRMYVTVRRCTI